MRNYSFTETHFMNNYPLIYCRFSPRYGRQKKSDRMVKIRLICRNPNVRSLLEPRDNRIVDCGKLQKMIRWQTLMTIGMVSFTNEYHYHAIPFEQIQSAGDFGVWGILQWHLMQRNFINFPLLNYFLLSSLISMLWDDLQRTYGCSYHGMVYDGILRLSMLEDCSELFECMDSMSRK